MSAIIISDKDNVAIVLRDIKIDERLTVGGHEIIAREKIPYTHKIAVKEIAEGEAVIKYGENIAVAAKEIRPGEWVHVHNILSDRIE